MRTGSAIRQASQEGYLLRRSVGETRIRQKFLGSDWTVRGSIDAQNKEGKNADEQVGKNPHCVYCSTLKTIRR